MTDRTNLHCKLPKKLHGNTVPTSLWARAVIAAARAEQSAERGALGELLRVFEHGTEPPDINVVSDNVVPKRYVNYSHP